MISYPTEIEAGVSHIELASLTFDQWNLNITLRKYDNNAVIGVTQLVFQAVAGFRYLDEGDMLRYPFPDRSTSHYIHEIDQGGWLQQELEYKNMVPHDNRREYLVSTINECVSVITTIEPVLLRTEP